MRVWKSQYAALEEKATRCEQWEKANDGLARELEQARSAVQRVHNLEEDNKQLRRELEATLQHRRGDVLANTILQPRGSNVTSNSSDTAPMLKHDPQSTPKQGSSKSYDQLVVKYNNLHQNWQHEKKMKNEYLAKIEKQRVKVAEWEAVVQRQKRQLDRRDRIIKQLKDVSGRQSDITGGRSTPKMAEGKGNDRLASSLQVSDEARPNIKSSIAVVEPSAQSYVVQTGHVSGALTDVTPEFADLVEETPPERAHILGEPAASIYAANLIVQDSENEEDTEIPLELPKLPASIDHQELELGTGAIDNNQHSDTNSLTQDKIMGNGDSPVFLSVKRVKKRRLRLPQARDTKTTVKIELSSSPTGLARALDSSDSLDLDEIGEKTDTPKKQRRLLELSRGRRALSDDTDSPKSESQRLELNRLRAVSEQISQETPIRQVGSSRRTSALHSLSVNKQILLQTIDEPSAKRRRVATDKEIGRLIEGGEMPVTALRAKSDDPIAGRLQSLLQNSSPTKVFLSSAQLSTSRAPQNGKRSNQKVAIYREPLQNEEAENSKQEFHQVRPSPSNTNAYRTKEMINTGQTRSLIEKLPLSMGNYRTSLEDQAARCNMSPLVSKPYPMAKDDQTIPSPSLRSLNKVSRIAAASKSNKVVPKRQTRIGQTIEEWEVDPDQEPLRTRPVESLRMEDFKINPNYNQGYNFAFKEVVRDRNTRQDLQGCVKPGCCLEKWRAMAIAQRNPNALLTAAQEEADEELLEEFLGDNLYKLRIMNNEERKEVLLQARIRQIANQHGKHRHAYERPSTPPGFWRADFPTTQEDAEDQEQADKDYKGQVKQRYDEAMRGDGRYLFKDE